MVTRNLLCAFACLSEVVAGRALSARQNQNPDDTIPIPTFKSDFKKGNVFAQWAPGYPKKWGDEISRLQFNEPVPEDTFEGVVTDDEKYVGMFNGTHATFVDLDTKATISTFTLGLPTDLYKQAFMVRKASKGEYDVLISVSNSRFGWTSKIVRRRLSTTLQPMGEELYYEIGDIASFDRDGRMATTDGYIVDFESTKDPVKLENPPRVTDMSFSGDGQFLSTVGWEDKSADLFNATSGEHIIKFPATNAQNWVTRISPDNKYVVISLGTGSIQIYSIDNLTAPPIVLGPFNYWIRSIEWSPDGKYLATGDMDRLQLWKFPEVEVVQTWQVDNPYSRDQPANGFPPLAITWMDGGNKVAWDYRFGTYMYDFEKNEKYWFTPGLEDHWWRTSGWRGNGLYFLKKKGLVATVNGDSYVRIWKL